MKTRSQVTPKIGKWWDDEEELFWVVGIVKAKRPVGAAQGVRDGTLAVGPVYAEELRNCHWYPITHILETSAGVSDLVNSKFF